MQNRNIIATGVAALCAVCATAQTLVFPGFTGASGLSLNDASVTTGGSVLLASSASDRRGSVFTTSQYAVTAGFSAVFAFRISSPGGVSDGTSAGADGLAFVLQRQGATALGGTGEALGYGQRGGTGAITPSVAVEFDTFQNTWDPNSNHVGVNTGGNLTSLATTNIAAAFDDSSLWNVWVDYNGTTLEVRAAKSTVRPTAATLSTTLDLATTLGGSSAFVGFTGATGSAYGTHEIVNFAFSQTYLNGGLAAVPEPSTYALLALGLVVVGYVARRRRG